MTLFIVARRADRLRFVNASLDAFVTDATQECSVEQTGDVWSRDRKSHASCYEREAVDVDEAVAALRALLSAPRAKRRRGVRRGAGRKRAPSTSRGRGRSRASRLEPSNTSDTEHKQLRTVCS